MGLRDAIFSYSGAATTAAIVAIWWLVSDLLEERRQSRRRKEWLEYVAKMRLEPREWREKDLREYNGEDPQRPLLIGVDGEVFNVWAGRNFYGADAPYGSFAGRDATRLLAKYIVDDADDDGEPLTAEELDTLESWKELFRYKYEHVGTLLA
uniref:Cytochrome b5 heme-binding domain-containing protein n=1 Tax=Prorocentrum micans TaxID=2945 RepID=A0A7S2TAL9_PROMC|mmetsp:Transcript_12151/g.9747  ORF Transcript_12151/g.9747 Transcript_12151/m.9747 type:complete len:152 (+) Transcript_12151:167-622(+)